MKLKKGQIAIFILLGIVILIAVGFIFYLKGGVEENEVERIQQIPKEAEPFKLYIDECVKKTAVEGAYFLGQQGGYYNLQENYLATFLIDIPFYYNKGKNTVPSIEILQREFSKYINNNLANFFDPSAPI